MPPMMMIGISRAQKALPVALQPLAHRQRLALGQVDLAQHEAPGDDQAGAHQQSGHDARDKQGGDRGVGRHAVDHEGHRRRNDRRDDAAGGNQPAGGGHRVALLAHHRQQDGGQGGGVGQGGAAHAGHQHGRGDCHVTQAAADVAHPGLRHVDDAPADPAGVHQLAGQDEEGHREQRKAVDTGHQVLRQQLRVPEIEHPGHAGAGQHQGQAHVHANAHEHQHAH
jgi:hypothetical protein